MTTRRQAIEIETVSFIAIAIFISTFFVWRNHQSSQQPLHLTVPITTKFATQTAAVPTSPPIVKVDMASQTSSDGTKKLTMKTMQNPNGTSTYNFSVSDETGVELPVFSKTLDSKKSMSIPFNTWSSNNQYFFIQENTNHGNDAMVFNASGAPFANGEAYLDITDSFKQNSMGNIFSEATGWASETLIIVNTTTPANTKGPSYWFEVPSRGVTQLSTEF